MVEIIIDSDSKFQVKMGLEIWNLKFETQKTSTLLFLVSSIPFKEAT